MGMQVVRTKTRTRIEVICPELLPGKRVTQENPPKFCIGMQMVPHRRVYGALGATPQNTLAKKSNVNLFSYIH